MTASGAQTVTAALSSAAVILVGTIAEGDEAAAAVRRCCGDFPGLVRSIGFRDPDSELSAVLGFGADVWPRLFALAPPPQLHRFVAVDGVHLAPSTPGDLVLHIRAARLDLCFELATQFVRALGTAFVAEYEVQGFRYFDNRDLLGFVDGSENPTGDDVAAWTLVPDRGDESPYTGGSFLIVQKYLHDLDAWNQLSTEQQEAVIGRAKVTNVELPDDAIPSSAHRLLNTITDNDGNELKIVRDNMPFGNTAAGEYGTLFLGYAADPAITERMLRHMFVGDPPGNYDRILDVSRAVTGGLFFAPAAELLEQLADSAP